MTAKRIQNTHDKKQTIERVKKKGELFQAFYKHYTAYEFNKIIEMAKSYKNLNQINIFKKISIKVVLK